MIYEAHATGYSFTIKDPAERYDVVVSTSNCLTMRTIDRTYQDPLELIWIQTAAELGIKVERDATVFASWDGAGTLLIGTPETLDADDSLAQMIFHEICHALVEGPEAFQLPDWGLESDNPAHRVREHACLRLQAALADKYGLREFLASTTVYRKYYDSLPSNPLDDDGDPSVAPAQAGRQRSHEEPWSAPLDRALRLTFGIADLVSRIAPVASLWSHGS